MADLCAICGKELEPGGQRFVRATTDYGILAKNPGVTFQTAWHVTCGPIDWHPDDEVGGDS